MGSFRPHNEVLTERQVRKTQCLQGYDKDTFVFIGIRGQEVRMHRLSFGISTLPPRYRYG